MSHPVSHSQQNSGTNSFNSLPSHNSSNSNSFNNLPSHNNQQNDPNFFNAVSHNSKNRTCTYVSQGFEANWNNASSQQSQQPQVIDPFKRQNPVEDKASTLKNQINAMFSQTAQSQQQAFAGMNWQQQMMVSFWREKLSEAFRGLISCIDGPATNDARKSNDASKPNDGKFWREIFCRQIGILQIIFLLEIKSLVTISKKKFWRENYFSDLSIDATTTTIPRTVPTSTTTTNESYGKSFIFWRENHFGGKILFCIQQAFE